MACGKSFCVSAILIFLKFLIVDGVIVPTHLGQVLGTKEKSRIGREYFSFRGLRYAQPPVGPLRFAPPQDVEPWSNVYNATEDGPICPQEWDGEQSELSEDCLVLNVYSNDLSAKKPVILFMHGGSFISGSGHSDHVGPQYFMDEGNIVLVAINYRLGILGFITTGTKEAPGNLGFKDQVMALKWVNRNIEKFGGDPGKVTIVGQSAGGISVTLHLVSPMSRGLFHQVISMSGSASTRIPALNRKQTEIISEAVGCPKIDGQGPAGDIVSCLKTVPVQELIKASRRLNEFGRNPIRKWNWVVEEDFGQERFLIEDANLSMMKGRFEKVPFMTGVTSTEFATFAIEIPRDAKLLKDMNYKFDEVAPICFLYERETDKSYGISNTLRSEYFDYEGISEENFDQLAQLFSDGILRSGLKRLVDRVRRYTDVYLYTNSFSGRFSNLYYPEGEPYGMVHGDDLLYLFVSKSPAPMFKKGDPENVMVERMTRIWASFARNGKPTTPRSRLWTHTNSTSLNWYELSGDTSHRDFLDYLHIWDSLFPELK